MAQVAQFSQLDGINKLNATVTEMVTMQNLTQGANLIGKTVSYATSTTGGVAKGVVSSVAATNGNIQLMINGVGVSLSQVRSVEAGPKT
jgi:flagellar basal-body rod modification protein FlgD